MKTAKQRSNSKGPDKTYLTWEQYEKLVEELCKNMQAYKSVCPKLYGVYGVPRGGALLAVILSHFLGIKYYPFLPPRPPRRKGIFLIVDDISDTGTTFWKIFNETLKTWGPTQFLTASLYVHKKNKYEPTFYVQKNEKWIVFPYERD